LTSFIQEPEAAERCFFTMGRNYPLGELSANVWQWSVIFSVGENSCQL